MKGVVVLILIFCLIGFGSATEYYVKNNGNDSLDGKSDATAWKTINKVNSFNFTTGDDVYFKCGDVWKRQQLVIDWSGNSSNPVVVGVYGDCDEGNKPVFDGEDVMPSAEYAGIVKIKSVTDNVVINKYVIFENIKVVNSEGEGIEVNWCNYVNISNVEIENTYQAGIQFTDSDYGIISESDFYNTSRVRAENPERHMWPSAINIMTYSNNNLIKNNSVRLNQGEGIGLYKKANYNIVEDNLVYQNWRAEIYISNAKGNIVRRNLCYGLSAETPHTGIGLDDEEQIGYAESENNVFFNNMVANTATGIHLWSSHPDSVVKNIKVYNNVIVDCLQGIVVSTPAENSEIKNNIIWCISDDCKLVSNVTNKISGLLFDYNLWSSKPSGVAVGENDIYSVPMLNRTTGWRTLNPTKLTADDFQLQSNSPAINKGANLSIGYSKDYFGNVRGTDGAWDIGAVEYVFGVAPICGNNITETGEICDGVDLNGQNCPGVNVSFVSGNLSCFLNCSGYDVSRCVVGSGTCSVRLSNINEKMNDWQTGKCVLGDVIALIRQWVAEGRC